jgi:hypothetical protein
MSTTTKSYLICCLKTYPWIWFVFVSFGKCIVLYLSEQKLSNGHSTANLSNLSTRQNGLFQKCVGLARLADIRQPVLLGLARLADIRQPILLGLARLADIRQRPFLKKM